MIETSGDAGAVRGADNLVHDLIAIANDLRRHIDTVLAERGFEHRRPAFAPLLSLVWQSGVPQARLAEALSVSPQAASQMVGAAASAGLVTRVPNPDDGRSRLVVLTDHGRSFVAEGAAAITARASDYAAVLGARRFARFDLALGRLSSGLHLTTGDEPVARLASRTSIMAVSLLADDAMHSLQVAMRTAGHRHLTAGQTLVLVHIGPHGARPSDLARAQRVSRQAVSAVLNDLESSGFVRRRDHSNDGRGVLFLPTAKGRRVLGDYGAGLDVLEARYAAVLGHARLDELARGAKDLSRMLLLEHVFSLASDDPAVTDTPTERRQGDLAALGDELLRWLGEAEAWWLAGHLRQRVIDRIEIEEHNVVAEGG